MIRPETDPGVYWGVIGGWFVVALVVAWAGIYKLRAWRLVRDERRERRRLIKQRRKRRQKS